jgi:hypothetical protein
MPRELSSRLTPWYKFILPVIWISFFGMGTAVVFVAEVSAGPHGQRLSPEVKWLMLAIWIGAAGLIWWLCGRLKRVWLDGGALRISNYRREDRVPLARVAAVTENRWIKIRPVTVEFRAPTDFGDRIVVMPQVRWFLFWRPHPIAVELRRVVAEAQRG